MDAAEHRDAQGSVFVVQRERVFPRAFLSGILSVSARPLYCASREGVASGCSCQACFERRRVRAHNSNDELYKHPAWHSHLHSHLHLHLYLHLHLPRGSAAGMPLHRREPVQHAACPRSISRPGSSTVACDSRRTLALAPDSCSSFSHTRPT